MSALLGGATAAAFLVVVAYDKAEVAANDQFGHFALFWAAMIVGLFAPAALLARRDTSRVDRLAALGAVAVVTTWPKMLRTLSGPVYSDEFGHLFSVGAIVRDGPFSFRSNPLLLLAGDYPVMHWITAGLHGIGFETWTAAQIVAVSAHLATLFLIAALVHTVTGSGRTGAIAGALYAIQPGWMFFSAQFAYETVALPLLVATLFTALAAQQRNGASRIRYLVAAGVLGVATVFTHHFAGIVTALLLAVFAVVAGRDNLRRGDGAVVALIATVCAAWTATRIGSIWDYYAPAMTEPVASASDEANNRELFGDATIPAYEKYAGLAFPFVALTAVLFALWAAGVRSFWNRGPQMVLAALGALFFVSLPALLQASTAESAHRSWGYSFLGLVVVVSVGLTSDKASSRITWPSSVKATVAISVAFIALVGGVASGSNAAARFPGPAEVGNDSRSVSAEAGQLAEYMFDAYGPYTPVLADRYTAQQLAGLGSQRTLRPSPSFPLWNLLFLEPVESNVEELRAAAGALSAAGANLVVVDARMAEVRPGLGYWFARTEPGAKGYDIVPAPALAKFDCVAYSKPVVTFGPLTLYEVDPRAMATDPLACVIGAP